MSSNISIYAQKGKERIDFPVMQTSSVDTKYILDNGGYYGQARDFALSIERYKERYTFWLQPPDKKSPYNRQCFVDIKRHCNELDNWVRKYHTKGYQIIVYGD